MTNYQLPITNYQLPITNYQLPITNYLHYYGRAIVFHNLKSNLGGTIWQKMSKF
ncbi:MAG: hypothetical protein HC849_01955 [Oscillatoriales cyanobacterium RU_3_3]|nr:hypothetical protein [Microcoleus sp. SU_5_6]NJM59238.1 hypothetical protein [Oscillatoriales cyanobacterium RU_3_3]